MVKYVMKQMTKYGHVAPLKPQHCPYLPNPIKYGKDNLPHSITVPYWMRQERNKSNKLSVASSIKTSQPIPWLHVDTSRCNNTVPCIWHDSQCTLLYLSAPKAHSRAGGYFFLGSLPRDGDPIKLNGAIHVTCTILKLVAASAAEAELGALFLNAQEAKVIWLVLAELGHPQPPPPIHIDNTTTVGIVNNTIKWQRSRLMEMQYFWFLDGETQQYVKF